MLVSLDRTGEPNELITPHNLDKAVLSVRLRAFSKGSVPARQTLLYGASEARALDRSTFRQCARGLTIHRGAASPTLSLRHPWFIDPYVPGALLVPQGRRLDYYLAPADLLHDQRA